MQPPLPYSATRVGKFHQTRGMACVLMLGMDITPLQLILVLEAPIGRYLFKMRE